MCFVYQWIFDNKLITLNLLEIVLIYYSDF